MNGSQHYANKGIEADAVRDAYFAGLGIKVLRYSNAEINQQFDRVCEDILQNMTVHTTQKQDKPSP